MSTFTEFLHMGGYAFYVWTSYAMTFLLIGGILVWSARELRVTRQRVFERARRAEKRR